MLDVPGEGPKTSLIETYLGLPFFKRRLVYRKLSREDQMRLDRHLRERKKGLPKTGTGSSNNDGDDKSEALPLSPRFLDHVHPMINDHASNTGPSTRAFLKAHISSEGYSNV